MVFQILVLRSLFLFMLLGMHSIHGQELLILVLLQIEIIYLSQMKEDQDISPHILENGIHIKHKDVKI